MAHCQTNAYITGMLYADLDAEVQNTALRTRLVLAGEQGLSGTLLCGEDASITLNGGAIVDVRAGPLDGDAALCRLLLVNPSGVVFEPLIGDARPSPSRALDAVLRVDAQVHKLLRLADRIGGLSQVWTLRLEVFLPRLGELPDGIQPLVRLLDGRRSVREVVRASPLVDVLTLRTLHKLLALGMLEVPVWSPAKKSVLPQAVRTAEGKVEPDGLEAELLRLVNDAPRAVEVAHAQTPEQAADELGAWVGPSEPSQLPMVVPRGLTVLQAIVLFCAAASAGMMAALWWLGRAS